jgi:hypothetical protein
MTKQTIQLLFKALVIGILVNVSLGRVPQTAQSINDVDVAPSSQQIPANTHHDMLTSEK